MPCLSIKTDPLAGSVAWSIFHNYSSAWRLPHPYLSVYSRSRPQRRLNVICRTKFDFDESMGQDWKRETLVGRAGGSFGFVGSEIRRSIDLVSLKFNRFCGNFK